MIFNPWNSKYYKVSKEILKKKKEIFMEILCVWKKIHIYSQTI